jgi:hypothetical protein
MTDFGKRVWDAVEESQGFGFISDDIRGRDDDDAYQVARDALEWERETVKRLAALIRSYESARDRRIAKRAADILARAAVAPPPESETPTTE